MAHATTKDPFGFVGSHVIRQPCSSNNSNDGPVPPLSRGASVFASSDGSADGAHEEHGWITRYDAQLDAYTLFIPGKGASVHSRTDVLKLVADPNFVVQHDSDDATAMAAPTEDTTSRYVGVPMTKSAIGGGGGATVRGTVQCYLPFADAFRVAFDDGTREDVSEDALINSMILMLTAPARDEPTLTSSRKRKRDGVADIALPAPARPPVPSPPATVRSVSAPVVSVRVPPVSMMPVSYSAVLGMDSSPVVTPSNILELAAARNSSSSSVTPVPVPPLLPPTMTAMTTVMTPVSVPVPPLQPPVTTSTPLAPVSLPFVKDEPLLPSLPPSSSSSSTNIISLIDDEAADVAMIPLELDDVVMVPVIAASDGNDPWAASTAATASSEPPPFYVAPSGLSEPVAPLDSRSSAFKCVREELVHLLDRPEASAKKLAIQYDILQNPDIKPISSIKRFSEASGLVVLNHLIATYLSVHGDVARAADVLLLLKIVAMLPIPAKEYVARSKIALTIGKLAKPRSREEYPTLPVAIMHLAKWIKRKWTEHFRKLEEQEENGTGRQALAPAPAPTPANASRSGHPSHRLGTRTTPPGDGAAARGGAAAGTAQRDNRLADATPIPRLANRPVLADAGASASAAPRPTADVNGNPIAAARTNMSLPLSTSGPASGGRKSSLKPDWLRQQENLRRTRFTSEGGQDSAAEYNHYKRVRQHQQQSGSSGSQSASQRATNSSSSRDAHVDTNNESEQLESAGGARGTFGRKQRLSFSSRWSVTEFYRDAPPSAVRRAAASRSSSSCGAGRPRSILRRVSKYQGSLDSFQ